MKPNLKKALGLAVASAVVLLGSAVPAQAATAEWQVQKDAYRIAVTQYKAAKESRRAQLTAIRNTFRAAVAAAKTGPKESRKAAVEAARTARTAAVAALGAGPVKPIRPARPAAPAPAPAAGSTTP